MTQSLARNAGEKMELWSRREMCVRVRRRNEKPDAQTYIPPCLPQELPLSCGTVGSRGHYEYILKSTAHSKTHGFRIRFWVTSGWRKVMGL
jgi:hypothetical protein